MSLWHVTKSKGQKQDRKLEFSGERQGSQATQRALFGKNEPGILKHKRIWPPKSRRELMVMVEERWEQKHPGARRRCLKEKELTVPTRDSLKQEQARRERRAGVSFAHVYLSPVPFGWQQTINTRRALESDGCLSTRCRVHSWGCVLIIPPRTPHCYPWG